MTDYRFAYLGLNAKRQNASGVGAATVNLGSMSGAGSSTRIFNYCRATAVIPDNCFNQFLGRNSEQNSNWSSFNGGLNGAVNIVAYDQNSNRLYIGGDFTANSNNLTLNYICYWDYNNKTWNNLAGGTNGYVAAICIVNGNVFVGGGFNHALDSSGNKVSNTRNICYWDINTNTWNSLSNHSPNGPVNVIATENAASSILWIGGGFTQIGSSEYNLIASWNSENNTYSALGNASQNGINDGTGNCTIYAIYVTSTQLYIGGQFTKVSNIQSGSNIVAWNISNGTWSQLGTPNFSSNDYVSSVVPLQNNIIIGGNFTNITGSGSGNYIAQYSNGNWSKLGQDNFNNIIYTIISYNNTLYIGGQFNGGIVKFDSSNNFVLIGNGLYQYILCLAINTSSNYLLAGGYFTSSVNPPVVTLNNIAESKF
jgi:hypothetical protein